MLSPTQGEKMTTIWKFPVTMKDEDDIEIEMPTGAYILTVQSQGDPVFAVPFVWARVDPEAPKEKRLFRVFGTGYPIEEPGLFYIGTFQMRAGALVFHLFEKPRPS